MTSMMEIFSLILDFIDSVWAVISLIFVWFVVKIPKKYRAFEKTLYRFSITRKWFGPIFRLFNKLFRLRKLDYFGSYIPDEEQEFYEIFARELSKAKTVIYNSGDGFSMNKSERGKKFATSAEKTDFLDAAMLHAMNKNPALHFHRFQIRSACNISWLSRLIAMIEVAEIQGKPQQFHVYIDDKYDHIGCFSAN